MEPGRRPPYADLSYEQEGRPDEGNPDAPGRTHGPLLQKHPGQIASDKTGCSGNYYAHVIIPPKPSQMVGTHSPDFHGGPELHAYACRYLIRITGGP